MKGFRVFLYSSFLIYLFSSCANRVTPTGGEKDVKPPVVVKESPPNYSTNFKAKEVEITFDELVELKELQKQLITSPLMDPAPVITSNKRSVVIKLPDTLRISTTYTLNFGSAIADIHEGNAIESFQYVFSTGLVLDSFICRGRAVDAWKQEGEKGITILLFDAFDDSLPFKRKPDYFARTNDDGSFIIRNIRPGNYMITALNDKNGNYICDSPQDEAISLSSSITIPDTSEVILNYFVQASATLYIKKAGRTNEREWEVAMNKPSDTLHLQPFNSTQPVFLNEWNATYDTAFVWSSDSLQDSLILKVMKGNEEIDTVRIRLKSPPTRGKGEVFNSSMIKGGVAMSGQQMKKPLEITFVNPVSSIAKDKIILKEDSVVALKMTATHVPLNRKLLIDYAWKDDHQYLLTLLPGAVVDFAGVMNDTLNFPFRIISPDELGAVHLTLTNLPQGNLLLQLVNADFTTKYEQHISSSGKFIIESLDPGKYKIRIINDENRNGRWDTGNYFQKKTPEKVYYYPGEIQVRANWELEQEWNVMK